jgi:uncharacterized membrane protein
VAPTEREAQPEPTDDTAAGVASVIARNIEVLREHNRRRQREATLPDKLAQTVTRFAGSLPFVWLHLALFGAWIAMNLGWVPHVPRFDRSFVILGTMASVEAIFLSTFVLIAQNRMSAANDRRDELDLQINLLAEHEVTRLIKLVTLVAERLGVNEATDPGLEELKQDVTPEQVLDKMDEADDEPDQRP